MFLDLYLTLGDGAFRQGFRNLYLMSEVEDVNGEKVSVGIDELRVVFQSYAAAIANITARWYDGIVPHDESRLDPGPVDARLTGINGGLDRAFVSPTEDGAPVSSFSAAGVNDLLWLTLEYSYRVLGGPHETRLEVVERFEDGLRYPPPERDADRRGAVHRRGYTASGRRGARGAVGAGPLLGVCLRERAQGGGGRVRGCPLGEGR